MAKRQTFAGTKFAVPKTYAEALQLAADQAKQIEKNERRLAAAKYGGIAEEQQYKIDYVDTCCYSERPLLSAGEKVRYYDDLVRIGHNASLYDTAMLFKMKFQSFIIWLLSRDYIHCNEKGRLRPNPELPHLLIYEKGQILVTVQGRATMLQTIKRERTDIRLMLDK